MPGLVGRWLLVAVVVVVSAPESRGQETLGGTERWARPADPAAEMVEGIHRYLDRRTADSVGRRASRWRRDFATREAYERSVEPNRARLRAILGVAGERGVPAGLEYVGTPERPDGVVARSERATARVVRWATYPGVEAEGLLLEPKGEPALDVVAMADCDVTPEQFAGLAPGLETDQQVGRLLAEAGCRVLIPTLIDRGTEFSGTPGVAFTNLTHREWLYRMTYEAGRHPIGYEVDKVRAGVDWLRGEGRRPVAVVGHGEGGLIALHAAAVDPRIGAAWVAGFFGPREGVWKEPIERNVWGLLEEFGDAEVASLVAPRSLLIESCRGPSFVGPPPPRNGRSLAASGRLATPAKAEVESEVERLRGLVAGLKWDGLRVQEGESRPWNEGGKALRAFLAMAVGREVDGASAPARWSDVRALPDAKGRMGRQLGQLVDYTQRLLRTSELRRAARLPKPGDPARWAEAMKGERAAFHEQLIGKLPPPDEAIRVRSALVYDEPKWRGYAVEIPVWKDVVASGVLLLPKDLKEGERRPVVVCQHGLEGQPEPVCDRKIQSPYEAYGARLADLGYIVYAPQNPYTGHDRFRQIQRKANPLKASLFSVIVEQHRRTLEWLASRPEVDPARIGFYGLSYGGKTAMRVPAILDGYCLSICSADFNEWVVKCTNLDRSYSYLFTEEYDMYEFGLAERANYAEMAGMIAPRPFLVERGHLDNVAPDEWVGYEFAKVRRTYDSLGIGDRAGIAYFNGPHRIDGRESFRFLAKHLDWPRGRADGD